METELTGGEQGTEGGDWREGLPEDIRSDASLEQFKDVGGLAKSYITTKQMVGNSIQIPDADASPEEWDERFCAKLRPPTPEEYELKRPEPVNGAVYDEDLEKAFRGAAHQFGLHPRQAQGLLDWYNEHQGGLIGQYQQNMEEGVAALKQEWGADWDRKSALANSFVKTHGGDEVQKVFNDTGVGDHPVLIKFFAELGEAVEETTSPSKERTEGTVGSAEIQKKIAEVFADLNHAYHRSERPGHQEAVEQMKRWHEQLHPE